ncbi:hypothetical protein O181_077627 [Austropuccinia psidii MF-1]|uniref:Uncharacterized protein n=1 Tax=Austropuccinia psidii MF-1 TaxID=1389203 RepID=A0A9Q3IEV3_9BASI|nr:hypothetical protein [Austropuccinia psidii MF-1]
MEDQKDKGILKPVNQDDLAASSCIRCQLETESLGHSLTPHLDKDESNFHQWSRSLNCLVENIFDIESYFSSEEHDGNQGRNRQIPTFIEKSIDQALQHHTDDEDEARKFYALLRDRFDRTSWSRVMTLWGDLVNGLDAAEDLNSHYSEICNTIKNLKLSLPGGFTQEN